MKKITIFAFAFVLQTLLVPSFASQVKAISGVSVLTHSGFFDYNGCYHVVGEVENTGEQAVDSVKITAAFYNSHGTVVATEFNHTYISVLLAEQKSPFEIIVADTTQAERVDHYSLTVTSSPAEALPIGLEILANSWYLDGGGCLHVVGEIENIGKQATTHIKVVATFYDETEKVVDSELTFSDPDDLYPTQSAEFEIVLKRTGIVPSVKSYALIAESNQYAIIPEFSPTILPTLLMISASVAAIIARKRIPRKRTKKTI